MMVADATVIWLRSVEKPELRLEVFKEHGKVWFSLEKWRFLVFN
jgi:hypothetical protein